MPHARPYHIPLEKTKQKSLVAEKNTLAATGFEQATIWSVVHCHNHSAIKILILKHANQNIYTIFNLISAQCA